MTNPTSHSLEVTVIGDPAPQGSKRHVGHGVMIESSKRVKPWREAVAAAAFEARNGQPPLDGPLVLTVTFWLPKPASLSRRVTALGPFRKPDLSKLLRSTEDALVTSGAVTDDARFVQVWMQKAYVDPGGHCGATIMIGPVGGPFLRESPMGVQTCAREAL